jgi:hypothetical protein
VCVQRELASLKHDTSLLATVKLLNSNSVVGGYQIFACLPRNLELVIFLTQTSSNQSVTGVIFLGQEAVQSEARRHECHAQWVELAPVAGTNQPGESHDDLG